MSKKVYVAMSGGVDSSVTAAILKDQGYQIVGVYMKNWTKDLPGMVCSWQEDYQDAKRVAVQLGIDFKVYDFETEYRQTVVDYMVKGYRLGLTPNPDVMCNQEIKFKLFLEAALTDGADLIATGHYAQSSKGQLFTGLDANKDQSYFLYRITTKALQHSLLPIGKLEKTAVRSLAKKFGLATANKKDSQGICFVGKIGIKDFLLSELGSQPKGPIIDKDGHIVGEHDGALFYTIGQRHGLSVGGGLPFYVTGKNMQKNEVYVTNDLQDTGLWKKGLVLNAVHWINEQPVEAKKYQVRSRYRAPLVKCSLRFNDHQDQLEVFLEEEIRAVTPGQSAVIYDQDRVLGGGIVI
ncbi:MAG TPA: tRNA 2-thiouridine(34) synthase MnmA [Candidatus Dormibacteraeota bacterium]|nr:tRNA 2-thiouridine(34) synthase MnmA [Candidatus Dormibacteraeota bacterium]